MVLPPWLWRLVHSRLFWCNLIGLPIAGMILFYTIANVSGSARLDRAYEALAANGYALTWDEVIKRSVPPDDDLLGKAVMTRKPADLNAVLISKGYDVKNLEMWIPDADENTRFSAAAICGRPPEEEEESLEQLKQDLSAMEPLASEIKSAVRSSDGIGWRISRSVRIPENPTIATVGWMSTCILRRAVLNAAAGAGDEAVDDLKVVHDYLAMLRSQPRDLLSLVIGVGVESSFVNAARQVIGSPSMNSSQLRVIAAWLESMDDGKQAVDCYQLVLVETNELVSPLFGSITALKPDEMHLRFNWMDAREWPADFRSLWWQVRPVGLYKAELADALLRIDRDFLRDPDGNKRESWSWQDADRLEAHGDSQPRSGTASGGPAYGHLLDKSAYSVAPAIIRKSLRNRNHVRLFRVGLAVELYHRDHGTFPGRLEELVPVYLDEIPVDTITAAPIRFESDTEGRFTLVAGGHGTDSEQRFVIPGK